LLKNTGITVILSLVFLCINTYSSHCEVPVTGVVTVIKTLDVNKDGKPDVIYQGDGKYVTKVEADTNFDGKPDITVHVKEGKFESAEVDTNYDGKIEKKFTDVKEFNKWLNQNHPDFNDKLNRRDWKFNALKF